MAAYGSGRCDSTSWLMSPIRRGSEVGWARGRGRGESICWLKRVWVLVLTWFITFQDFYPTQARHWIPDYRILFPQSCSVATFADHRWSTCLALDQTLRNLWHLQQWANCRMALPGSETNGWLVGYHQIWFQHISILGPGHWSPPELLKRFFQPPRNRELGIQSHLIWWQSNLIEWLPYYNYCIAEGISHWHALKFNHMWKSLFCTKRWS